MRFGEAVKALLEGKKVRMTTWRKELYINQRNKIVYLFEVQPNGLPKLITIDEPFKLEDILSTDWEIIDEQSTQEDER